MSGTCSSVRTKLWWNSHWMVLFQNCVRQSRSPTKMAATVQLRCYWKQLWSRWAITGPWEPLVILSHQTTVTWRLYFIVDTKVKSREYPEHQYWPDICRPMRNKNVSELYYLDDDFHIGLVSRRAVLCDWVLRVAGVHAGFRTITLVLYIGSLPWFPCGREKALFIFGSWGQR